MHSETDPPTYDRCAALAEAGKHKEARAAYEALLAAEPDHGRALNDLGALCYAQGRLDEAADLLRRAADHLGDERGQALWNLAEVWLAARRPAEAAALFGPMQEAGLLSPDLVSRTAGAQIDAGDAAGAVETLIGAIRAQPAMKDALLPAYEVVRSKRPKVAFLAEFGDTKFLKDIVEYVGVRYETRLARGQSDEETAELLRWCDIAWLEWCTNQAVLASHLPKTCRTIVRLHRFEAFTPWPERVDWDQIDALVTVGNPAILEALETKVPDLASRTHVEPIPNGVDLERFRFRARRRGKNLAAVGYLNARKNPGLLLQCFRRLLDADPEYRLFFAGEYQDDGSLRQYVEMLVAELGLAGAVRFDGWQSDVAAWLADKHYLVSASTSEGHPVGVLEAMARGVVPVVHVFPGAKAMLPEQYLYRTPAEFCRRILYGPYAPAACRACIEREYPRARQLARVAALVARMEAAPCEKPAVFHAAAPADVDAFLDGVASADG